MIGAALAFAAAVLAVAGFAELLPVAGGRARRRGFLRSRRGDPPWGPAAPALRVLAAAGRRLRPALGVTAPRELEARIAAAGLAGPAQGALGGLDARELMAAKLATTAIGAVGGLLLGAAAPGRLGLLVTVTGPVGGFLAPDLWLARRARDRARVVRRELPGMLDLLRVSVQAGLPLSAALGAVGDQTRGVLGAEWRIVGRDVALGVPLSESLQAMERRAPLPEIRVLIAALGRTIVHGAPLAETLAAQARDAREARRRRIREEAARAGPKIQLVVALLLVPSVLLLVAAALAAALIDGRGGFLVG